MNLIYFVVNMYNLLDQVHELETAGPFTGMGFFTIEKGTLSSMVEITLTYTIILVQMKP